MSAPAGQFALVEQLGLRVPGPHVESQIGATARRTIITPERTQEFYPRGYARGDRTLDHVEFALRHEPLDLGVLAAAFRTIGPDPVIERVRREPTGAIGRRIWFLYETLTGETLDLTIATNKQYVDALDPARHFVADRRPSPRHRVYDNLLGVPGFAPTIRLTNHLRARMADRLDQRTRELIGQYEPSMLARAVIYLYTKETRSSFAIEGENPSSARTDRFVRVLERAADLDPTSPAELLRLQGAIVDPRFSATGWRDFQSFIGLSVSTPIEKVYYVPPKPEDVPPLMNAWAMMTRRLETSSVDAVVAAAVVAFAFVYVHPYIDGNGRIHRFLIHRVLAKRDFTPTGVIFPVSAAIVRERQRYYDMLETVSSRLFPFIEWRMTPELTVAVSNETIDLYRYLDLTNMAEYLYDRVAETIEHDLAEQLRFLVRFDRAFAEVQEIVDMPDRDVSLFLRLTLQNGGRLSKNKREHFAKLTDEEIARMEHAVREVGV